MEWWQWVLIAIGLGVVLVVVMSSGDIARYIKIKNM
jgi:hypothetical protein